MTLSEEAPASVSADEPLKFTLARFEAVHADPAPSAAEREAIRERMRADLRPPALIPEQWRVVEDFVYWDEAPGKGERHLVPAGFVFDGASVPWPLTVLVPKTHPMYLAAAALHDHLYAERWQEVPRPHADRLFLDALLVSGLNWIWSGMMWRAVRAGGWAVWWKRTDTLLGRFLRGPAFLVIPARIAGTVVLGLVGAFYDFVDLVTGKGIYSHYREIRAADIANATP